MQQIPNSTVNNSSRIRGQRVRIWSLAGRHADSIATDHVISPPPVERTNSGFFVHGIGVEPDGFRFAGALKRGIDCNPDYKVLDERP